MPVTVTRLPDEPIVVAHFQGRMDLATIRSMFNQTAAIVHELAPPVYRVENFLAADASIRDLAHVLVEGNRGTPGSTRDPRIVPVIVAGRNRVRLLFETMRRDEFGGRHLPIFDSLDEALAHIRRQLGGQQAIHV